MRSEIQINQIATRKILLTICSKPIKGQKFADWLLEQCFKRLGKDEMAHCGSRWRRRIKENPDKMRRVLADVRAMQKEGMAIKNPGAYAEDLWKRFA